MKKVNPQQVKDENCPEWELKNEALAGLMLLQQTSISNPKKLKNLHNLKLLLIEALIDRNINHLQLFCNKFQEKEDIFKENLLTSLDNINNNAFHVLSYNKKYTTSKVNILYNFCSTPLIKKIIGTKK